MTTELTEAEWQIILAFNFDLHAIEERAAILEIDGEHNPQSALRAALVDALVSWILARPKPAGKAAGAMLMLEAFLESGEEHFPARGEDLAAQEGKDTGPAGNAA